MLPKHGIGTESDVSTAERLDVTGSIVAYKTAPDDIRRSAEAFLSAPLRVQLHIIDNSPTDSLRSQCEQMGAVYRHVGRNLGYGRAHNIVMRECFTHARYHLVLNPDIQFESSVLTRLVDLCDENPRVGLAMPRVLYPNGSPQYLCKRLPSVQDVLARRFYPKVLQSLVKTRMQAYELRDFDLDCILSAPCLSGCFMFLKTEALREVGLFDERFFMYFEDFDLSRRIHEKYETLYYPMVSILHDHGKGSYRNLRLLKHHCISAIRYFNKWGWISDRQRLAMNAAIGPIDMTRASE